jgi:hypothetical protein
MFLLLDRRFNTTVKGFEDFLEEYYQIRIP